MRDPGNDIDSAPVESGTGILIFRLQSANHCLSRLNKSLFITVTQIPPRISNPRNTKPVIQEEQSIPFLHFILKSHIKIYNL